MNIVITGATAGIGLGCARAFCDEGHRVVGIARSAATLRAMESELTGFTGIACDIADETSVAGLGPRIAETFGTGGVDALINNAGYGAAGPVELVALSEWKAQYAVNVFGTIAVTQEVLPLLRQARRARIINVSSVAGRVYAPFFGPYYSTKHALGTITHALRMELHEQNISVTLIEPGAVQTGFSGNEDAMLERYANESPLYRDAIRKVIDWHQDLVRQGVQPETIVEAIREAVRANPPKARYVVPKFPSYIFIGLMKLLPLSVTDAVVRRLIKLG